MELLGKRSRMDDYHRRLQRQVDFSSFARTSLASAMTRDFRVQSIRLDPGFEVDLGSQLCHYADLMADAWDEHEYHKRLMAGWCAFVPPEDQTAIMDTLLEQKPHPRFEQAHNHWLRVSTVVLHFYHRELLTDLLQRSPRPDEAKASA